MELLLKPCNSLCVSWVHGIVNAAVCARLAAKVTLSRGLINPPECSVATLSNALRP